MVDRLLHINVRCTDLERSRTFYEQILGLTVGYRPPFQSTGYWLYLDDEPLIHLTQRSSSETHHAGSGNVDHIAFLAGDLEAARATLRDAGVEFREAVVPRDGTVQIFVHDPNGVQVELNFSAASSSRTPPTR